MVDAKAIVSGYRCDKCHKLYHVQDLAEQCCRIKEVDYSLATNFTITEQHLKLLKEMCVE
jgi:hypothetical protein